MAREEDHFTELSYCCKENIDALYPSDRKVELYFFKPMQARGCSGHPNVGRSCHYLLKNLLLSLRSYYNSVTPFPQIISVG